MKACIIKKIFLPKCTKTLIATIPNLRPFTQLPFHPIECTFLSPIWWNVSHDACIALYSFDGTWYIWHSSHVHINPFHVLHSFNGTSCNWHPFHACINPFNASFLHPWTCVMCPCVMCAFRKRTILHIRHTKE